MTNFMNGIFVYDDSHDGYNELFETMNIRFNAIINSGGKIFTTNVEELFDVYLENLPEYAQQNYNCRSCRHFLNRFGGLVTVNEKGEMASAMFDEDVTPPFFLQAVKAMKKMVLKSKINGVFISSEQTLGQPVTGEWTHFYLKMPKEMVYRGRVLTAGQTMAEKKQDFKMLINALLTYPVDIVDQALTLLNSEALYRSDKCLGVAKWFKELHVKRDSMKNSRNKENVTWLAVATAPNGFTHIKSSMIGTLLDDIANGLSFDAVSRRFAEKMNPSNYMRSQVAPSQGNIQQAEKIVDKLGIAESLLRRYATIEEIPEFLWKNNYTTRKTEKPQSTNVFGNITPKEKATTTPKVTLPSAVMTWEKFNRTILPTAENIEVMVDNPNRLMALVTASVEDSENILQWNNPFSWYYHGGIDGEIKRRVESQGGQYENNEIRCSLIWENYTDLDLHCITPHGEEIGFRNKKARRSDGWLDIDMNAGGSVSLTPVENIRFKNNAPSGEYTFYVHNFSERGKGITPFKCELEVNGKIYTFNGELSNKNRVDVFKFRYVKGQQPEIISNSNIVSDDSWSVSLNNFVKVNGITNSPNQWGKQPVTHTGNHIFFLLDGCKDLSEGKGRGFFNEILKPELHEIRKTLEAYIANTPIEDADKASACGVGFSKDGGEWNLTLKVTSNNSTRIIKIDRWD